MTLIRTLLFTVLVPGSVTMGIPYLLLSSGPMAFSNAVASFRIVGFVPIAVGAAIYLWCAWDFAFAGKGTPAPWDAPREFVSRGLYRIVRNPMYLGVLLILAGEAIGFRSLTLAAYAGLVWLLFHLFAVYYEEPTLKRQFGAPYVEYCRRVPRWLPGSWRAWQRASERSGSSPG